MKALSRQTDHVYNTTLFLIGGWYKSRITAAEPKRLDFDFVQLRCHDAEGPHEKTSRHTVCLVRQGRTLVQGNLHYCSLEHQPPQL